MDLEVPEKEDDAHLARVLICDQGHVSLWPNALRPYPKICFVTFKALYINGRMQDVACHASLKPKWLALRIEEPDGPEDS